MEVESSRPVTLTEENLTGLFMHTDVRPSGSFACSNPLLNKIWEATMQAYRSNLHSIPTDCPQREKNGWTADAHIAIDLGLLGFDGITLYEKWMNDIIDNQREAGEISGIIPAVGDMASGRVRFGTLSCLSSRTPCMIIMASLVV